MVASATALFEDKCIHFGNQHYFWMYYTYLDRGRSTHKFFITKFVFATFARCADWANSKLCFKRRADSIVPNGRAIIWSIGGRVKCERRIRIDNTI